MAKPRTSNRDAAALLGRLGPWLDERIGTPQPVRITSLGGPDGAGLSSDTLLLDLDWDANGPMHRPVVLRLPPPDDASPVFASYDLARQVDAMRTVRAHTDAPVPEILWADTSGAAIGVPFFLMERVDGLVPPDILPYTWGSWVTELDPASIDTMSDDAVDILIAIHAAPPSAQLISAAIADAPDASPEASMLERHVAKVRAHFDWAARGRSYPTVERGWDLVRSTMPTIDRPDVLVWGDARIGNILWRDARAVGVLDWEMTTIGPRELDLAWLLYFAEYFQMSAEGRGHPGVPTLLRREHVVDRYERATGVEPIALDWFLALTALHQTSIGIRTTDRAIEFGEYPPEAAEESALHSIAQLHHRLDTLERI